MGVERCHQMAVMAGAAYLDKKEGTKKFKELGYDKVKFLDKKGAQCYIVQNESEMVLCFRGTQPTQMSDVAADLNALPDRSQIGGFVHNGFQNEVEKLWDDIHKIVAKKPKEQKLFITGHSLGGAMSTICASRLQEVVDTVYTYGSPRVGGKKFVSNCNFRHYRHVNNNDAVCTVPFGILGYRHHSIARYINHYGRIRPLTPWQRFKDKLRGRWAAIKNLQFFDGFRDHGMDYYIKYTAANCGCGDCKCGK